MRKNDGDHALSNDEHCKFAEAVELLRLVMNRTEGELFSRAQKTNMPYFELKAFLDKVRTDES